MVITNTIQCCLYTPLYNSKQVSKLHLNRSSGKHAEVQLTTSSSIGLESFMTSYSGGAVVYCHLIDARVTLECLPA